jgi:hypothetical protein
MRQPKTRLTRCGRTGLVILADEIQAKLVLAERLRKDTGETRYFACGKHYHLSAMDRNEAIANREPA